MLQVAGSKAWLCRCATVLLYRTSAAMTSCRMLGTTVGQFCLPLSTMVVMCCGSGESSKANVHKEVKVHQKMTVAALARQLGAPLRTVSRVLQNTDFRSLGDPKKVVPLKVQEQVILEMGHTPLLPRGGRGTSQQPRDPAHLKPRPPVVAVMGHVDHGKTTLLDRLRSTSVASQEAGGITQHIGAFSVTLESGFLITFLDTPGHAAFSAMRARGADVTDIVILVVAADDGVMEQTRECVRLVQQAKVPLVVAINKCDKHGVNVNRVKQELLSHGVQLEEFGGDVQAVEVSALRGSGLTSLEEAVLAQAELCDLRGDQEGSIEGVVIESRMDRGLGAVATVVLQHGTLRCGDILVAGSTWAKVRTMLSDQQKPLKRALPSTPVLTVGWKDVPAAGDLCRQVVSEQLARAAASKHALEARKRVEMARQPWTSGKERERMSVFVLVKGDVMGSVEAVVDVLSAQQLQQLDLSVLHSGVGAVSEGDVEMAASAQGLILAFNVSHTKAVGSLAMKKGVQVLEHNVIYKLLEQLKEALESQLPPVWEEEVVGEGVVLKVFQLRGAQGAAVGGCRVKQGRLVRNATFRILRNGKAIHEGNIVGMKHGKDDIDFARKETECGISFSSDPGFQEGDTVQCFTRKQVPQQLQWQLNF